MIKCGMVKVVFLTYFFYPIFFRMNMCTTVTDSDVARGKKSLKASLVAQLNGI
jgi:hypothetical protein